MLLCYSCYAFSCPNNHTRLAKTFSNIIIHFLWPLFARKPTYLKIVCSGNKLLWLRHKIPFSMPNYFEICSLKQAVSTRNACAAVIKEINRLIEKNRLTSLWDKIALSQRGNSTTDVNKDVFSLLSHENCWYLLSCTH
jgi:hypothetical protein